MLDPQDFHVKNLGRPDILSPFEYSSTYGDGIVNFISDDLKVPFSLKHPPEPSHKDLYFEYAGPRKHIFFNPEEVTAGILTCGGLCPGLNNAIRSIVMQLYYKYQVRKILGFRYGQKGFDPEFGYDPIDLTPQRVVHIHQRGGSILGVSRGKVSTEIIVDTLVRQNVNVLLCLGGDGTQRGLHAIHEEIEKRGLKIACTGVPKTIDNDISFVYKTFGMDTAVTIASEAVRSAHSEAESAYNGIGIVKVMGRHSGFIACNTTLANSDVNYCLIPEIDFDLYGKGSLLDALETRLARRHHAVIVVAEGAGQNMMQSDERAKTYDASGNIKLQDIGIYLKNKIIEYFKEKNIPIDLKYIDPSYMIRSVATNANDSIFAAELGRMAVDAAMAGKTDCLVGFWHGQYTHVPLLLATSKRKTVIPEGELWREVLSTTGQPISLKRQC